MYIRVVIKILGVLQFFLSLSMLIPMGVSFWNGNSEEVRAFGWSILVGLVVGATLFFANRNARGRIDRKEALVLVSSSWFLGSAIAALPFWIWGILHSFVDGADPAFAQYINCYFEAMSGFTTTGASVLSQIESIPDGLLLWRSLTQWIGGLGIVVIFVAVLPMLAGHSAKKLIGSEATGIQASSLNQHTFRETAQALFVIYGALSVLAIVVLKLVDWDLDWLTAVNHGLATLATGGFSNRNASAGALGAIDQWVLIVFMIIAGVNFRLYHQLVTGQWRDALRDRELHWYLGFMAVAFVVISVAMWGRSFVEMSGAPYDGSISMLVRDVLFQIASVQTTTGFATSDFNQWDLLSQSVLVALMFIGGCGGSTAGGLKVIRIVVALKIIITEIEKSFRPSVVRPIRVGRLSVTQNQGMSVLAYIVAMVFITFLCAWILEWTEAGIDATTALTASISAINNIGPGLGGVGPIHNFGGFSSPGKLLLCIEMAVGRLEFFAVALLFLPMLWKNK